MSASKHVNAGLVSVLDESQEKTPITQSSPNAPTFSVSQSNSLFTKMAKAILHELDVAERLLRSNAGGTSFVFLGSLLSRFLHNPPPSLPAAAEAALRSRPANPRRRLPLQLRPRHLQSNHLPRRRRPRQTPPPHPRRPPHLPQARLRWFLSWTLSPLALYHFHGPWAPGPRSTSSSRPWSPSATSGPGGSPGSCRTYSSPSST